MQLVQRNIYPFAHTAVLMHTKYLHLFTAVFESTPARATFTTVHIGSDAASIADLKRVRLVRRADLGDFQGQFVAQNARVAKEGLVSLECMDVRSTYPHLTDAHLDFISAGGGHRRCIHKMQRSRLG